MPTDAPYVDPTVQREFARLQQESLKARSGVAIAVVALVCFGGVLALLVFGLEFAPEGADWFDDLLMPALLIGWGIITLWACSAVVGARRKRIAAASSALATFAKRHSAKNTFSDDGRTVSQRQVQHEWYGEHYELGWRDREQGQLLGFTNADEYVSNWLEHDKD